jgi:hypothetical protein
MSPRAAAVIVLLALALAGCSAPDGATDTEVAGAGGAGRAPLRFGVLASSCDPSRAAAEKASGLDTAMIELSWNRYQPAPQQFDASYADEFRQKIAACRRAGLEVVLGLGLQYPPPWVLELSSGRFVDQYGSPSRLGEANLVFSRDVRNAAEGYFGQISTDLDLREVAAVRVGTNRTGELGYPGPIDGNDEGSHDFWGFDTAAQTGAALADGMTMTPMPGWAPGDRTWRDRPVTTEETTSWFRWYADSLIGSLSWQVGALRQVGFTGEFHVPVPGRGALPTDLAAALSGHLDGRNDPDGALERGLDYPGQFPIVADMDARLRAAVPPTRVLVDFTGLDDVTAVRARAGGAAQDTCRPDDTVDLFTRPGVDAWSGQRWTLAVARAVGLAAIGENPGPPDSPFTGGDAGSDEVADQLPRGIGYATDCGLERFLFAFEDELFESGSGVTLDDYARLIAGPN